MQPISPFNNLNIPEIPSLKAPSRIEAINRLNNLFSSDSLKKDMEQIEDYLKNNPKAFVKEDYLFFSAEIDLERIVESREWADLTLLDLAAGFGCVKVVQFLINESSEKSPLKGNPIVYASTNGHVEVLKLLLNNALGTAEVLSGEEGITSIYLAARKGHTEIVKLLIDHGVDCKSPITSGKYEGHTPIVAAAVKGYTEITKLLIDSRVDFKSPILSGKHEGQTPIFIASGTGQIEVIKLLIENGADYKSAIDRGDWEGESPFSIAAINGHIEVVKFLIDLGVDFTSAIQKGKFEGETPIFTAACSCNIDLVKLLVDLGVDCKSPLQSGRCKGETPIYVAAIKGMTNIVKLLIDHGAEFKSALQLPEGEDQTLLFSAAASGQTDVVKLLIENNADYKSALRSGEFEGQTPLHVATYYGFIEVVNLLIENGADYKSPIAQGCKCAGETPIYVAAYNGHTEIVKLLIEKGVDYQLPLQYGQSERLTPLIAAIFNGKAEVLKVLIDKGVDLKTPFQGNVVLHGSLIFIAAPLGHTEVVKLLIENGIDCKSANQSGSYKGQTPIYGAASKGRHEVVKLLIESGVDCKSAIQSGKEKGETPIFTAAQWGHVNVVEALIDYGVDFKSPIQRGRFEGQTPLYVAATNGHPEVVKLLIDHGVDCKLALQRGKREGTTPMCTAVASQKTDVVKLLIDNGVDGGVAMQSGIWKGITPFGVALANGHTEIVRLFIEKGVSFASATKTGKTKEKPPILIAACNGHTEIVSLLIQHDVYLECQETMPFGIQAIYYHEQKRESLILGLLNKKCPDKGFSFKWVTIDNLVYLSVKTPSVIFCQQGRSLLEKKGIHVRTSTHKDELRIRKSETNQLIKCMDEWLLACKLLEKLSNLFENRNLEQSNYVERGIFINLKPFDLVVYGRILKTLNAKIEENGCVFIPFELMNRNDVSLAELKKSANKNIEKMNRVIHLANTHGKAKVEYTENELQIRFKDEENLKRFSEILTICKPTKNSLELICSYDDILDFNLVAPVRSSSPNTVDRKSTCISSFKRALEPLIPNYNKWTNEEKFIEAELAPHYLAILEALSISGLSILDQKKIRVMVEKLEQLSEDEFNRIANGVKENQNKMSAFDRVFRKVSLKEGRLLNGQGYVFCFKDDDHKKCFESQFENVLVIAEGENQFLMTYPNVLQLDQEKLELFLKNIEKLTPVVQVVRPPAQPAQAVNYNNGPLVAVKKVQKKTKKKSKETKASVDSKPSAVASATKRSNGPNIAPQREIVWPKFERTGQSGMVQTTQEIDYTRKKAVPSVVLMNKKVALTDYEACIKHELEFLKGLCKWYDELDNDSKNDFADIYCDSLWLGLLRFYNGVYMRAKNAHKNYQKIIHLTSNDLDAKKIRACLIHYFRERKNLTEHYEKYVVESMGKIVENDFKLPNQKVELKSLSNCLLLQECKTIDDFYPIVKEQFSWIVRYLDILKEKASKQTKFLSDVFKCAVEGDMTDSSFRFLVHEAKAIEACLVKIGELHRYVKDDPRFEADLIKFIAKCRKLRNRITHQVGEEGYNPVSAETISRFAEEAKSFIEKF